MANPGAESFFGGLLQGVGQGMLGREQMQYEKKIRDAQSRQRIFETIANDPNMGWDDKATALEQSISNLLPKDKQGNPIPSPASEAIGKIVASYRQMGSAARNGNQQAQTQSPAAVTPGPPLDLRSGGGPVPSLPSMPELQPQPAPPAPAPTQAQAPAAASSLPSIPPLRFNAPSTPAERMSQQQAQVQYQMRMQELSAQAEIAAIQQQRSFETRKAMADKFLTPGTPAYVNAVFGQNIDTTRPETLDQSAADLFNKYRAGQLTKTQFDEGVQNLHDIKAVMEKPPTATDAMQSIANYFKLHGYNPDPNSPDYAKHWDEAHKAYTNETKVMPGVIRINALGNTRGVPLTDSTTGITSYYNWNDVNEMNRKFPGRYTAPAYDPETQAAISTGRALAPKNIGTQVQSYGTFIRHTGDLFRAVKSLNNTDAPLMNKPINWLRTNTGDPRVKAFLAKLDPVRTEFMSFLQNNRALYDDDRQKADAIIDENSSPAQMLAVLPSLVHTGTARLEEADAAYSRANKGKHVPNLVTPEALRVFKLMGVAPPQIEAGTGQIPNVGGRTLNAAPPPGATHIVPGPDGRNHYTNDAGTIDYGIAP